MPVREIRHPSAGTAYHDPRYLAIRWRPGVAPDAKAALLRENSLLPAATGLENRRPLLNVNHTEGLSWVESRRRGDAVDEATIRKLEESDHVAWVALAFHEGAGGAPFAVNPTRLYLSQQAVAATGSVNALNAGLVPDDERPSRIPGWVALKVAGASTADGHTAVEAARAAEKSVHALRAGPGGQVVRFESIPFYSPTCQAAGAMNCSGEVTPDDFVPAGQWGLHRAGFAQARQFAGGGGETIVALIDTGVESKHPNLRVDPCSWNASDNTPGGESFGNHGTACAGIISAASGSPAPGAARGVRIMSIATATWADVDIAEALYFAADNGARVVTMGFGVYASWRAWDFELVREALQYAHERGLVLVAAAGNENIPRARFPGSDARTLCVGGSNRNDERKHTLDDSAEKWWGACYGPDVDVVAPCLEIATTEGLGAQESSREDFNGTSSAAALAAGLAGLLVSRHPGLSGAQVRRLIERSCDKISPSLYRYSDKGTRPAGSWNIEVGYGRINAARALQAACAVKEELSPGGGEECDGKSTAVRSSLPSSKPDGSMVFYESSVLDSATFSARRRLEFRVVYEHSLRAVGRQQNPIMPGEQLRVGEYDQHRSGRLASEPASRLTAFRQMVNAVSKNRLAPEPPAGCLQDLGSVRPHSAAVTPFDGPSLESWIWPGSYETSLAGGASVRSACDAFTRSALIAARAIAAERSSAVTNPECDMRGYGMERVIKNRSRTDAVTYCIRRMDQVYEILSRVVCVQWRTGDAPWRAATDLTGLTGDLRDLFTYTITKLPRVGESVRGERHIIMPADGRCTQRHGHPAPSEGPAKRSPSHCSPLARHWGGYAGKTGARC